MTYLNLTEADVSFIALLENRFATHAYRHKDISWDNIRHALKTDPALRKKVMHMEATGGEPDVVVFENAAQPYFCDCAAETPLGRRSICYDEQARMARKKNPPEQSAVGLAERIGITLLTEAQYRTLQAVEAVDLKTSSWIQTPDAIRNLGGALFGDRRYDSVFIYHNGAESYYASRGFRGCCPVL